MKPDRVEAAPFVEWLHRRLAFLEREHPRTAGMDPERGRMLSARDALAYELGVDQRTVYRYLRSAVCTTNGERRKTDHVTATFRLDKVQEMLDHAGIPITEVYPHVGDVELEEDMWCDTCVQMTTPINGECPWCDSVVAA